MPAGRVQRPRCVRGQGGQVAYMRPLLAAHRSDSVRVELPRLFVRRGSAVSPTVYAKAPADMNGGGLGPLMPASPPDIKGSERHASDACGEHVGPLNGQHSTP